MKALCLALLASVWIANVSLVAASDHQARGLLSSLESVVDSALGISTANSAKTSTIVQSPASVAAETTSNSDAEVVTVTATKASESSAVASTESSNDSTLTAAASTSTSLTDSASSATTTQSSSTTGSSSIITDAVPSNPLQAAPTAPAQLSPPSSKDGNSVTPAGIGIAIAMSVVILAGIAYLFIKFHPGMSARLERWQEARQKRRTYRAGFDVDEEYGLAGRKGLGVGEVTKLKKQSFRSHNARYQGQGVSPVESRSYRPMYEQPNFSKQSMASSRPFSLHLSKPVSPIDDRPERTLLYEPPSLGQPRSIRSISPYRPPANLEIGLAIPMTSSRPVPVLVQRGLQKGLPPVPGATGGRSSKTLTKLKRLSGMI